MDAVAARAHGHLEDRGSGGKGREREVQSERVPGEEEGGRNEERGGEGTFGIGGLGQPSQSRHESVLVGERVEAGGVADVPPQAVGGNIVIDEGQSDDLPEVGIESVAGKAPGGRHLLCIFRESAREYPDPRRAGSPCRRRRGVGHWLLVPGPCRVRGKEEFEENEENEENEGSEKVTVRRIEEAEFALDQTVGPRWRLPRRSAGGAANEANLAEQQKCGGRFEERLIGSTRGCLPRIDACC